MDRSDSAASDNDLCCMVRSLADRIVDRFTLFGAIGAVFANSLPAVSTAGGKFLPDTADQSGDPNVTSVEETVDVDRPPEQVFASVSDLENNPAWQSGVETARFTSDGPLRVGSTYVQEAGLLGRRI